MSCPPWQAILPEKNDAVPCPSVCTPQKSKSTFPFHLPFLRLSDAQSTKESRACKSDQQRMTTKQNPGQFCPARYPDHRFTCRRSCRRPVEGSLETRRVWERRPRWCNEAACGNGTGQSTSMTNAAIRAKHWSSVRIEEEAIARHLSYSPDFVPRRRLGLQRNSSYLQTCAEGD
jgi:hypothetical protein